jgi:hypothetical protein
MFIVAFRWLILIETSVSAINLKNVTMKKNNQIKSMFSQSGITFLKAQCILALVLLTAFTSAQQLVFQRKYWLNAPAGEKYERSGLSEVVQDAGDDYYATGNTIHTIIQNNSQTNKRVLIKTNSKGDLQWIKTYSTGLPDDYPVGDLELVRDNSNADAGLIMANTGNGLIMLKTDLNGTALASKKYDIGNTGTFRKVLQVKQSPSGYDGFIAVGSSAASNGPPRGVIVKTDNNLNIVWSKRLTNVASAECVYQTHDFGFVVVGWKTVDLYTESCYISKLDVNGNILWTKFYNPTGEVTSLRGMEILEAPNGNGGYKYIVSGEIKGSGFRELFVMETNSIGSLTWMTQLNAGQWSSAGLGYINGQIIVNGTLPSPSVVKLNSTGTAITMAKVYLQSEMNCHVSPTIDNGLAIVGRTFTWTNVPDCMYFIKTDASLTSGCYEHNLSVNLTARSPQVQVVELTTAAITLQTDVPQQMQAPEYAEQTICRIDCPAETFEVHFLSACEGDVVDFSSYIPEGCHGQIPESVIAGQSTSWRLVCIDAGGCKHYIDIVLNVSPRVAHEAYVTVDCGANLNLLEIFGADLCGNDITWYKLPYILIASPFFVQLPNEVLAPEPIVTESATYIGVSLSNPCCRLVLHVDINPPARLNYDMCFVPGTTIPANLSSLLNCPGTVGWFKNGNPYTLNTFDSPGTFELRCTIGNCTRSIISFNMVTSPECVNPTVLFKCSDEPVTALWLCAPDQVPVVTFNGAPYALNADGTLTMNPTGVYTIKCYRQDGTLMSTRNIFVYPCSGYILRQQATNSTTSSDIQPLPATEVTAYPNPNDGTFKIGIGEVKGDLMISNLLGEVIYSQANAAGELSIDLKDQPEGVYILTFTNIENKSVVVKKILVQ